MKQGSALVYLLLTKFKNQLKSFFKSPGKLTYLIFLVLLVGLVVVSTVLPYILYTRGLARLDSGKAAILASVEPVVAALVGVFAFQEPMSVMVVLGLGCILASVYILR